MSTYWKCQLIGWAAYSFIPVMFLIDSQSNVYLLSTSGDITENTINYSYYLSVALKIILFGILISHLMRAAILKLNILDRSLLKQVCFLWALSFVFSMIFLGVVNVSLEGFHFSRYIHFRVEFFIQAILFSGAFIIWNLIYFLYQYITKIRKNEQSKAAMQIEILELEAKALRAQMDPHFIFNCMNSIKALIQNDEKQKAADYFTTFSKLIRTLFQNSDKRRISLYDEIETCQLYTQLEVMRLNGKLNYSFEIVRNLDLKSVLIPALIIQPFIENAIWHGIAPKENGTIAVSVKGNENAIVCEVDDDGIGREMSKLNKPAKSVIHESKGVKLSQARLNLERMLNDTDASIDIIDKYEKGTAAGTKVKITIRLK